MVWISGGGINSNRSSSLPHQTVALITDDHMFGGVTLLKKQVGTTRVSQREAAGLLVENVLKFCLCVCVCVHEVKGRRKSCDLIAEEDVYLLSYASDGCRGDGRNVDKDDGKEGKQKRESEQRLEELSDHEGAAEVS